MTDKLLNCPFCGGEAHYDRGRLTGISAVVCPCSSHVFFGAEKDRDATITAWNTRAERTCRMERTEIHLLPDVRLPFVRLDCGHEAIAQHEVRYCPTCGAKVVGE